MFQVMVISKIEDNRAKPTTLILMRDVFHDRLADYECLGDDIYTLFLFGKNMS